MRASALNSPRILEIKKKKRKVKRRKLFLIIFLLALFLAGLCYLSRWQKINISEIKISGNKVIETATIESIVKNDLSGYYLKVIPKTNFLLYPGGRIKSDLARTFKRLGNINLSVKDFRTLEVDVSERTALYTWCGDTFFNPENGDSFPSPEAGGSNTEEKCYFMDENGYVFDKAPYFSGEVYLKFYGYTSSHNEDPLGSYYFKPDFGKLVSFRDTLAKAGLKISSFYVKDNGDIGVFLSSSSPGTIGPEIIFKSDADFEKIAENLQTVLATDPIQSDFKNKYSSLLYIDLRFGDKVYYKFKGNGK